MDSVDTSDVYCMVDILPLQWDTRLFISAGLLSKMTRMSSMYLSQMRGWVPGQLVSKSASTLRGWQVWGPHLHGNIQSLGGQRPTFQGKSPETKTNIDRRAHN